MYLTYEEYIAMGGEVMELTAFNSLEFEARTTIDWWTFSRLQNETTYSDAVKRCMFELIRLIKNKRDAMITDGKSSDGTRKAGLIKESNDDVLAEYNVMSARSAADLSKQDMGIIVRQYLQGVRNSLGQVVLYRGIYPNE